MVFGFGVFCGFRFSSISIWFWVLASFVVAGFPLLAFGFRFSTNILAVFPDLVIDVVFGFSHNGALGEKNSNVIYFHFFFFISFFTKRRETVEKTGIA